MFYETFKPRGLSSDFIRNTVILFCTRLPEGDTLEAMQIACERMSGEVFDKADDEILTDKAEQCIKYFCGICWKRIREGQLQSVIVKEDNDG